MGDSLKKFFDDRHRDILRLTESLEKADRSRTDELRRQLDETERALSEYRLNLDKMESAEPPSSEANRFRSVCDEAVLKLEQLIETLKQGFDSSDGP